MNNTYAIIDNNTKYIINLVIWDGVSNFDIPENSTIKLFSSLKEEEIIFAPKENPIGETDI